MNWMIQIFIGIEYIHSMRIIHRDVKASNIFLSSYEIVKLGDFGISRMLDNCNEAAMTVVGTPFYMSPELCQNKPYTMKTDIWSLGCLLYELCEFKVFIIRILLKLIIYYLLCTKLCKKISNLFQIFIVRI